MKTSEVFTRAKQHLAKDFEETRNRPRKEKFICIALITAAANCERITEGDRIRCTAIVESRIDTYTLEGWLVNRGCIPEQFLNDHNTLDRIQEHRHAWIDMLIAEFKAKGD
jgi:hypothetical protein